MDRNARIRAPDRCPPGSLKLTTFTFWKRTVKAIGSKKTGPRKQPENLTSNKLSPIPVPWRTHPSLVPFSSTLSICFHSALDSPASSFLHPSCADGSAAARLEIAGRQSLRIGKAVLFETCTLTPRQFVENVIAERQGGSGDSKYVLRRRPT
jgi:hypothetical protein